MKEKIIEQRGIKLREQRKGRLQIGGKWKRTSKSQFELLTFLGPEDMKSIKIDSVRKGWKSIKVCW